MISLDDVSLEGRVAVVTGAAQGIGRATAIGLANFGADVAICDRKAEVEDTAEIVRSGGRRAVVGQFDVRDPDAVGAHLDEVVAEFGHVDILVNNAGGGFQAPFLDINDKGTKALVDENYTQVLHFIRGCIPLFPDHGGSIINITSVEAHRAAPGFSIYSSMKAAVEQLTRTLALEFADRRVRVNAISCDAIATEGDNALSAAIGAGPGEYLIPWTRHGEPDDVVGAILFLACRLSTFVTGSTIQVTGGTDAARGWRRDGRGGWHVGG